MRIALVTPYSWTYQGGVNRHVQSLAEEYISRGHFVRVIAPFDPPDRLSKVLHRAPAEAREIPDYLIPVGRTVGINANGAVSNIPIFPSGVTETRRAYGPEPLTRYAADLVVPGQVAAEVALLKALALRYVMSDRDRREQQSRQRELLRELTIALNDRAPKDLEPVFQELWREAPDDAGRLRVVIDQVAALTDAQARRWHRRLVGGEPDPPMMS